MIPLLHLLLSLLLLPFLLVSGEDKEYFDNDLAKICRPLDRNLDLLFVLDGSGSTGGNTFDTQLDMVRRVSDLVEIAPNKTRIAVLQYSGYTRIEFDFLVFQSKEELNWALSHIRHISGTTKTGKALEKASETFHENYGARLKDPEVAQVAVVVSDGHSHDDPVPAAESLRRRGFTLMAVGIGQFINMRELVLIAGDEKLTFTNNSIDNFVDSFRKIAIGERCDYVKGPNGAEVTCGNDSVSIDIATRRKFHGHLYVPGFFGFQGCTAQARTEDPNSVQLQIPLNRCGMQKQFLFTPRGLLFETTLILKFHPEYHTEFDKQFPIRCFYPDKRKYPSDNGKAYKPHPEAPFKLASGRTIQETLFSLDEFDRIQSSREVEKDSSYHVSSHFVPEMQLPCSYKLVENTPNECLVENLNVGRTLTHLWTCDHDSIGTKYGMLVHSCFISDGFFGKHLQVLDKNGCSLDETIMPTPSYLSPLKATTRGHIVKYADHPMMQFHCSVRFCNQEKGDCDPILPPKCDRTTRRRRRQVLGDGAPPLRLAHMPPHVLERLFRRRQYFQEQIRRKNLGLPPQSPLPRRRPRPTTTPTPHNPPETSTSIPFEEIPVQGIGAVVKSGSSETDWPVHLEPLPVIEVEEEAAATTVRTPRVQLKLFAQQLVEQIAAGVPKEHLPTESRSPAEAAQEKQRTTAGVHKERLPDESRSPPAPEVALKQQLTAGIPNEYLPLGFRSPPEAAQEKEVQATSYSRITVTEPPKNTEAVTEEIWGAITTKSHEDSEKGTSTSPPLTTSTIGSSSSDENTATVALEQVPYVPWHWVQVDGRWVRRIVKQTSPSPSEPPTSTELLTTTTEAWKWVLEDENWVQRKLSSLTTTPEPQLALVTEAPETVLEEGSGEAHEEEAVTKKTEKPEVTERTTERSVTTSHPPSKPTEAVEEEGTTSVRPRRTTERPVTTAPIVTTAQPVEEEEGSTTARVRIVSTSETSTDAPATTSSSEPETHSTPSRELLTKSEARSSQTTSASPELKTRPPKQSESASSTERVFTAPASSTQPERREPTVGVAPIRRTSPPWKEIRVTGVRVEKGKEGKMELEGLSNDILDELTFGEITLDSQIVMVHDREEDFNSGKSLLNWCPR